MKLKNEEIDFIRYNYLDLTAEEIHFYLTNKYNKRRTLKTVQTKIKEFQIKDEKNKKNRQRLKLQAEENPHKYRAIILYKGALERTKAKEKKYNISIPFDITPEWIEEKLKSGICEVSGTSLYVKPYKAKEDQIGYEKIHPRAASLDQINPGAGYTKDNVRVICDCLNKLFSDKHDGEIFNIVNNFVNKTKREIKLC